MNTHFLLSDPNLLQVHRIVIEAHSLTLVVSPKSSSAGCPDCRSKSTRVHSQYTRRPADLPSSGLAVCLEMNIRRFFCDNRACFRRTFTERLPSFIASFARRTNRLADAQRAIGFSAGGEEGARLAAKLGMTTSPDTLLRLIVAAPEADAPCPRVLGVDDWAFRKRHTYGTILVDLEQNRVVDLLPDREPKRLAGWLKDHPGIEIISRDRGQEYIEGINLGAPHVVQVADRFHLLQNLLEVTDRLMQRCPKDLQQTLTESGFQDVGQDEQKMASKLIPVEKAVSTHRQLRFDAVKALQAEGKGRREVARQLGLDRRTVSKYFHLDEPPKRAIQNSSSSKALPYLEDIQKYLDEGCHSLTEMLSKLQAQGFRGCYASLHRAVHGRLGARNLRKASQSKREAVVFSPRQAAWLLIRPMDSLREQQKAFRLAMCKKSEVAAKACDLAQFFRGMIENRQAEKLDQWLKQAEESQIVEFERFATSLRTDYAAVKTALVYPWSNGQVEGQVNRLKMIKRQMYGRASFELLRRRVLRQGNL